MPYTYRTNVTEEHENATGTAFVVDYEGSHIAQATTYKGRKFLRLVVDLANKSENEQMKRFIQ